MSDIVGDFSSIQNLFWLIIGILVPLIWFSINYSQHTKPYGSIRNTIIMPYLSRLATSNGCQHFLWFVNKAFRRRNGKGVLYVFIAADDPHSFVLLQCLPKILLTTKDLVIKIVVLNFGITPWAHQSAKAWILQDSQRFAELYELEIPQDVDISKAESKFRDATMELLRHNNSDNYKGALEIFRVMWNNIDGHDVKSTTTDLSILDKNYHTLCRLGYYGPGVVEYEGEIYTLPRLHHLERRLLNVSNIVDSRLYFVREIDTDYSSLITSKQVTQLHLANPIVVSLFYSFRSPYSQLAVTRLRLMCHYFGVKLVIKPILPMVARKLEVPFSKVMYIVRDCAREARMWKSDFGFCCDPVKPHFKGVFRAFDAYLVARRYSLEVAYLEAFSEMVWTRGYDAATDRGMRAVCDKAGLKWTEVQPMFGTKDSELAWTELTTVNAKELDDMEMWGVPCVKCGDMLVWGQDKLYLIEQELKRRVV